MTRQDFRWLWLSAGLLAGSPAPLAAQEEPPRAVRVSAANAWTDTGLEIEAGRPLHIEAGGIVRIARWRARDWLIGPEGEHRVGPDGTYLWDPRLRDEPDERARPFPLPAMADGPVPAFCLIGRIGADGVPFVVGSRYDAVAAGSGRLWLGINDFDVRDNRGAFEAIVTFVASPPRAGPVPPVLGPERGPGRPVPGARALLIYVDGLRPDVLREMAEAGFLPAFRRAFIDGGLAVPDTFTVFPSNTLITNGSLFTGRFSDRTGIKSQNQFERTTLKPRGQLSKWLPDGFMPQPMTRILNLLDKYAPEHTHAFLVGRGIPTLGSRLGKAFRFTTLPIAPLNPPPQWFHRAMNTLGPVGASARLPRHLDTVNADYAVEEMLGDPDARVLAVWFPLVDKTCHHSARGQFGAARRDLVIADRLLDRILRRLRELGWEDTTYLILVSDHGHMGGDTGVNATCNLARDWAHRTLGCNAKVVGQEWAHPGIDASRFLFIDNQGAGQAKLFLPYASYFRGPWRRNRLHELTHYDLRPRAPPVDLLASLASFRPPGWDGRGRAPVDLILVKLDERRVFLYRDEETQAVIHREEETGGGETYRYEPVRGLTQAPDGAVRSEAAAPGRDPLGYLQEPSFLAAVGGAHWLQRAHSAREWLHATAKTRYPDAVVTMAKFFAWQEPVADLAEVRDPDLVVTASPGWSFRSDDGEGTDHGYPLAESMRMTLVFDGPNIPFGILPEPHRVVDVLPTVLEMIGWPHDPADFDGDPIRGLYD